MLTLCEGTSKHSVLSFLGCRAVWNWWDMCIVTKGQSDPSVRNVILFNDAFVLLSLHNNIKGKITFVFPE